MSFVAGRGVIEIVADLDRLQRDLGQAQRVVQGMGSQFNAALGPATTALQAVAARAQTLSAALGGGGGAIGGSLTAAIAGSSRALSGLTAGLGPAGAALGSFAGGAVAAAGGLAALNTGLALAQDRMATLDVRLKQTLGSQTAARDAFAAISRSAADTGVSLQSVAEAFLRFSQTADTLGATRGQIALLSETIQKLGLLSGASTQEVGAGMLQLSQALAAGRLNGDELRSIMEQMPALARAIADGLGVGVGQLKEMGAAGELTSQKVFAAILAQSEKVKADFAQLPDTTERAFTRLRDSFTGLAADLGRALDSSAITQGLLNAIRRAIDNVRPSISGPGIGEQVAAQAGLLGRLGGGAPDANGYVPRAAALAQQQLDTLLAQQAASARGAMRAAEVDSMRQLETMLNASVAAAAPLVASLDEVGNKTRVASENVALLEKAIARLNQIQRENPSEENARRLGQYTKALGFAREELAKAQQVGRNDKKVVDEAAKAAEELRRRLQRSEEEYLEGIVRAAEEAFELEGQLNRRRLEERRKALEEEKRAEFEALAAAEARAAARVKRLTDLDEEIRRQREANEEIGKEGLALFEVRDARLADAIALREHTAALLENTGGTSEATQAMREEIARLQELRELRRQAAQEQGRGAERRGEEAAARKAAEDARREWERTADVIERTLTDALMRGFESGKGFAKNLRDAVVNLFRTLVLRPIIQAVVAPVAGGVLGAIAPGVASAASSAAGGASLLNYASLGQSAYNVASGGGFVSGASSIVGAAGNAMGSGVVSAYGAGLGMTSAQAAQATAAYYYAADAAKTAAEANAYMEAGTAISQGQSAGAILGPMAAGAAGIFGGNLISGKYSVAGDGNQTVASAAGAAIGAYIGTVVFPAVGTAIGAFVGGLIGGVVNRAFGRAPREYEDPRLIGTFTSSGVSGVLGADWVEKGGWFRSDKRGMDTRDIDPALIDAFSLATASTRARFDLLSRVSGSPLAAQDFSYSVDARLTNEQDALAIMRAVGDAMGRTLLPQLEGLRREGESLADTASRLTAVFATTDEIARTLGQAVNTAFGEAGLGSAGARQALVDLFGGIQGLVEATGRYVDLFQTDGEKLARLTENVSAALAQLDIDPTIRTKEAFRGVVEGLDLATASGQRTFAALMQLAPTFAQLVDSIAATEQAAQEAAKALRDQLAAELDAARSAVMQAYEAEKRRVEALEAAAASARDAVLGAYSAMQETARGLRSTADAAASAAREAFARAEQNVDAVRQQYEAATQTLLSAYQQEAQQKEELANRMRSLAATLAQARAALGLGGLSTLSPEDRLALARRQFADAAGLARTGDLTAAGDLPRLAQAFLDASRTYNATSEPFARDFALVDETLRTIGERSEAQATEAEAQLAALKRQVESLGIIRDATQSFDDAFQAWTEAGAALRVAEAQLEVQRQQLQAAGLAAESTLSLSEAIAEFVEADTAADTAEAQVEIARQQLEAQGLLREDVKSVETLLAEYLAATDVATAARAQLTAAEAQMTSLGLLNQTVQSLSDAIAALQAVIARQAQAAEAAQPSPLEQSIRDIYQSVFGRAPDALGLNYWMRDAAQFGSEADLRRAIIYGAQTTDRPQVVDELYQELFGRAPDAEGLAYWQSLAAKFGSVEQLRRAMIDGATGADLDRLRALGIRTYAEGGAFGPGMAIVGERGPELVSFMGTGRVFSNGDTRGMLAAANEPVVAALDRTARIQTAGFTALDERLAQVEARLAGIERKARLEAAA